MLQLQPLPCPTCNVHLLLQLLCVCACALTAPPAAGVLRDSVAFCRSITEDATQCYHTSRPLGLDLDYAMFTHPHEHPPDPRMVGTPEQSRSQDLRGGSHRELAMSRLWSESGHCMPGYSGPSLGAANR